ncbi:MAG: 30S ribosome-binding factor RbfA [Flavobacteriaceae bacterium]|nr:30S ribosome-binding factor RbfA [Flavobacteriaceae bacterium]
METNRQKKIAGVIQKDLAILLQNDARNGMPGVILSVTKVSVTTDLSIAKVFLSIFPNDKCKLILEGIKANAPQIKHQIALRTKHQLRRMPELTFFLDDTLDYIETIDVALRGEDGNPIKDSSILPRRKKI